MFKLVLVRHGESEWNRENRFTGWTDVDLSEKGRAEALEGGRILKQEGYTFDVAYTSLLKRAIRTLWTILDEMDLMWIPVHRSWRLNERHYGALQGLNKSETADKFGEDQVKIWRRSYDIPPPPLDRSDLARYFPEIHDSAGECRFLNCLHHHEPDCAVKLALDKGLITDSRYRNYLSFLAEVLVKERTYS